MVDEGVVSFSVAASFLAAVPLCAIQGSWLAEWSFDLFFATWILAFLAAYPFVCALLNAYFLAALPVDRERMAASVPLQLFARAIAVERGCDVDQPRNLAKSVTVE